MISLRIKNDGVESMTKQNNLKGAVLFYSVDKTIVSILKLEFIKSGIGIFETDRKSDARTLLKNEEIDIILTDYDPEKPDNVDFFKRVHKRYPNLHRIFLAEDDYEEDVHDLILKGYANLYFEKPHGIGQILENVLHIIEIRKILRNKSLAKLLGQTDNLSTFLKTYYEFDEAIKNDESSKKIASIIEKDIPISTQVLKIANSAFYRSSRIGSIERACIYLGMETIKNIVFFVSLNVKKQMTKFFRNHMDRVVYHSLKVNQNFQRFYKLETGKMVAEQLTSVGLTHDLGKIIMIHYLPERFQKIIRYQKRNPELNFYRAELEMGFEGSTHAEIGAFFLDLWNFPEPNILCALYHHRPEDTFDSQREFMDIFSFVNEFAK